MDYIFKDLPANLDYENIILKFLRQIDHDVLENGIYYEKILDLKQYCRFQKYKGLLIIKWI